MRPFLLLLACLTLISGAALAAPSYDAAAVAKIHGGIVDCVGCNLVGADLSNTCVKAHDLTGANFDGANATLMCMSFANFTNVTFRGTDLSAANLAGAKMDGADLTGANFDGANATLMCMSFANFTNVTFRGTELSGANLAGARMDGADLTGAKTSITSFLGTDLSHVKGLTQAQLDVACSDKDTKLPAGLKIHICS